MCSVTNGCWVYTLTAGLRVEHSRISKSWKNAQMEGSWKSVKVEATLVHLVYLPTHSPIWFGRSFLRIRLSHFDAETNTFKNSLLRKLVALHTLQYSDLIRVNKLAEDFTDRPKGSGSNSSRDYEPQRLNQFSF